MKNCPKCGIENIDDAQFCRNCGLELTNNIEKVENIPQKVNNDDESIISMLFFKTDKYTGELRIAKAKSISIGIFVFAFLFGIFTGAPNVSIYIIFVSAILFGLLLPFQSMLYVLYWDMWLIGFKMGEI